MDKKRKQAFKLTITESGEFRYFSFASFPEKDLVQGIFTRKGGVSPEHWRSLNLGGTNGDSRANVVENRKRIFDLMGRKVESIFDVWQVHGVETICADSPRPLDSAHQQADIILTDRPEITLFMRFADCVPIFLYDPAKHVIGIVHAGWQGTVKKAATVAVERMTARYGSSPASILAGIGPSIGPDHYEVGEDVVHRVKNAYREESDVLLQEKPGGIYFNLWKANMFNLQHAGVKNIEIAEICTGCDIDNWYSHRLENGKTGRFGALLAMKNN